VGSVISPTLIYSATPFYLILGLVIWAIIFLSEFKKAEKLERQFFLFLFFFFILFIVGVWRAEFDLNYKEAIGYWTALLRK